MFSARIFIILAVTFGSIIHLEFIFIYGMRHRLRCIFFVYAYPVVPTPLIENIIFPHGIVLAL